MTDPQFIPNTPEIQEEWRPVPNYEGLYEVSNKGRVRGTGANLRNHRRKAGLLKIQKIRGYLNAALCDTTGKQWKFRVHRLVMAAFVGPCPEGKGVNHIDGIKHHNHVENLEYATPKENDEHALRMGLKPTGDRHWSRRCPEKAKKGEDHNKAKLTENDVLNIRFLHSQGMRGTDIHPFYDFVHIDSIWNVLRRKTWNHI